MCSPQVFKGVVVKVGSGIGSNGYTFFTSTEHGDVYLHRKTLSKSGFKSDDLVPGCTAVIDIVVEATGKQYTGHIYEINCIPGNEVAQNQQTIRQSKSSRKKNTFAAGVSSQEGKVKVLKEGYGFIEKPGYEDMFFPNKYVREGLRPYLKEGVEVWFDVEACERGLLARITDITWTDSQVGCELVDSNAKQGLYVIRVTDPTGQNTLEVRNGPSRVKSKLVALVKTRDEAIHVMNKGVALRIVPSSA